MCGASDSLQSVGHEHGEGDDPELLKLESINNQRRRTLKNDTVGELVGEVPAKLGWFFVGGDEIHDRNRVNTGFVDFGSEPGGEIVEIDGQGCRSGKSRERETEKKSREKK